jgi:zinc protease
MLCRFVAAALAFAGVLACPWSGPPAAAAPSSILQTPTDWPHSGSDLAPDPSVRFGRLPSGVRYALMANDNPKDRIVMHLVVQAGSLHESSGQLGLAHFLEHMMFNGSTHFPPGELVKYFQSIGMQFGGDANASTGFTETIYDIVLPANTETDIDRALTVFRDYAEGALLLPSEVERERGVILAEKRTRDSADWRAYVARLRFQMEGTRMPERLPIGDAAVISDAGVPRFKEFYDTWYRPERMIVVMVGDMDVGLAERLVAKHFQALEARGPEGGPIDVGLVGHEGVRTLYHHDDEAGNTTVSIETLSNETPVQDGVAFQQESLETLVVNRMLQHRLDAIVSAPGSPVTDASAGAGVFLQRFRYSGIEAECEPDQWRPALRRIETVLRQAIDYGFQEPELSRVRAEIASELEQAVREAPTRTSRSVSRELLYTLRANRVFRAPEQERDFFVPRLQSLTLSQVDERLRTVWSPEHRLIMVSGNADLLSGAGAPEEQIRSAFTDSRREPVQPPELLAAVDFPYLPAPESPGRVVAEVRDEDIGVERLIYANGFHLHLKRTDYAQGEFLFALSFGRGESQTPAALPGIADLSAAVLNESGVGPLPKHALERAMAGKQTRLSFVVGEDHFAFSGRSVPGEERLVFERLYAHLTDPAFREEALDLALERARQEDLSRRRSVEGAMSLFGYRFLAGGDNRFGRPRFEVLRRITLDDVHRWLGGILEREPLELSVVGDFDPEAVRRWASLYLGGLAAREAKAETDYRSPAVPEGQRLDIRVETDIDKAMVIVAHPTTDQWDIGRTRRLGVLGEIYSERLREEIREKLGAAYSPFAYHLPSRAYEGFGRLLAGAQVDPEQVAPIREAILAIARTLASGGVAEEELKRVVAPSLTGIKERMRRNDYWLNTVLRGASRHPEQLDWSRTIQSDYASITPEEVDRMARTYLGQGPPAVVTVEPAGP